MKHRTPSIAFAFLVALSLSSTVASAQTRADNPECLGDSCGRPKEAAPLVAGSFLEQVWAELLGLFR